MTRRGGRSATGLVVVGLLLGACGGAGGDDPTGADSGAVTVEQSTGTDAGSDVLASLTLVDPAAEFRRDIEPDFAAAVDGQDLAAGDVVRTDLSGFAIIDYVDESVVRLDIATEYVVVDLDGTAEAPVVRTRLEIGRAWHNVQDLAEEGAYEVETPVATASVRGTIFLTECLVRLLCTFAVLEGQVEVTPDQGDPILLGPGDQVTIRGAEVGDVEPAARIDEGDGFVDRNRFIDERGQDPGPARPRPEPGVVLAMDLEGVGRMGDRIPLAFVEGGFVAPEEAGCPTFHLHSQGEMTILGFGPFADLPDCSYGIVENVDGTEGFDRVTGGT